MRLVLPSAVVFKPEKEALGWFAMSILTLFHFLFSALRWSDLDHHVRGPCSVPEIGLRTVVMWHLHFAYCEAIPDHVFFASLIRSTNASRSASIRFLSMVSLDPQKLVRPDAFAVA